MENEKLTYIKILRRIYDEEHARYKKINDFQLIGERYLLLNLLGKGGFSEVYKVIIDLIYRVMILKSLNMLHVKFIN